MKSRMLILVVFVLTFVMPVALSAQETDPTAVVAALEEAINAGNVDAAAALFADDITFTMTMLGEDEMLTGAAEVRGFIEELVANDFQIQVEPLQVEGDTVTTKTLTWGGGMPPGVAPMEAEETYVVQDGKIKSITWVASEESNAKWLAAMAAMEATDPEAVINAVHASWNAGDFDALKALFADGAVVCMPDWGDDCATIPGLSAEELGIWFEDLAAANFVIEPESIEAEGDTVTVVAKVWADPTRAMGIAPLVTNDVYTVQDGLITSQTSTLDEESAAKLMAAMAPEEVPETGGAAMPTFAGLMVLGALVVLGGLSLVLRSLSGRSG